MDNDSAVLYRKEGAIGEITLNRPHNRNAMNGETFTLSSQPIWVQPVALALAAAQARSTP